jgi:hypothetical protein
MHRKMSAQPRKGGPTTEPRSAQTRLCGPTCTSVPLSSSAAAKTKFIGWRVIDKPLEEENGSLSGDGTRTTLRVGTVAEPPHHSLAGDLCHRAKVVCLAAAVEGITSFRKL